MNNPWRNLLRRHPRNTEPPPSTSLCDKPANPQLSCPLFAILPAEIRQIIWECAISDFPDQADDNRYSRSTYYTRPDYEAPRKSDVRLLRTCRAVYVECFALPFLLREHTWWLTSPDRYPDDFSYEQSWRRLVKSLALAQSAQARERERSSAGLQQPEVSTQDEEIVELAQFRVFAQMYRLEEGRLRTLLGLPGLYPQRIILTIRHADWWYWENDDPLRFEAQWIKSMATGLTSSTREFRLELETVARKKAQLEFIASHISRHWYFRRNDGIVLYGDTTCKSNIHSTWRGSSTWAGNRWIRDEVSEGVIEYCVISVPFRERAAVIRRGGQVDESFQDLEYDPERMRVTAPGTAIAEQGWVPVRGSHSAEESDSSEASEDD
ncbi:hypothetical protein CC79DRAFT_689499 [Sarocladium strictum]